MHYKNKLLQRGVLPRFYGRMSLGRTLADDGAGISPSVSIEMGAARCENLTGELKEERRISSAGLRLQVNAGKSVALGLVAAILCA